MFTSLDVQGLVDCLSQIRPVELEAVHLLQALPPSSAGGWFPAVPPDCVADAARDLIAYTKACAALTEKLKYLSPIILPTMDIPEWPL